MGVFAFILANRWTWYAGGAIALFGVLLGVRAHLVHKGEQQGQEQQKQAQQSDVELERKATAARTELQISEDTAKAKEADARGKRAEADAAMYAARAQSFAGQIADGRRQVAALPDGGLHAYVRSTLNLTPDVQGPYTPAEERAIADAVTTAPKLQQQNEALAGQVGKLTENVNALADKVSAIVDREQARAVYTNELERDYRTLYNLHPPRKRSPKCLWAWRCTDNKLAVPAPAELETKRPR
jgi:hypothetical protein